MTLNPDHGLLEADDSLLVIIDVQDKFLTRLTDSCAARVVDHAAWLARVAGWLQIPVLVTAEEVSAMGPTTGRIAEALPAGTREYDKMVFGLAGQEDIRSAVGDSARGTAILLGLETDVCVAQSALGLAQAGYRVAVVSDACAAPQDGHEAGLERLRNAGIVLVSTKGLFFEWVRDVERCHDFFRNSGIGVPEGLYIG
jgi:nicotinamidase-related amidase